MSSSASSDPQRPRVRVRRRAPQSRLLMVFAVLSTLVLVFCCLPLVVMNVLYGPTETLDPKKVLEVAERIAPVVIPPKYEGTVARYAENSLMQIRLTRFDHSEGRGKLVIGEWRMHALPPGNEYDTKFLQNSLEDLFTGMRMIDGKTTEKSIVIEGQEVKFQILEGEDRASTTTFKQVSGAYTGSQGAFQLILQGETEFLSDEAIQQLLESFAKPVASPETPSGS